MADPRGRLRKIRQGLSPAEWARVGGMVAVVVGLHVLGWGLLTAALNGHYQISKTTVFGVGTGALAYTLGMRHAFDADHIAAIDNTTRKLVNEGKRPLSVGFFFSLGHSSVVFVLAVLLNFGIRSLDDQVRNGNSGLHNITSVVGTCVSGFFLLLIAAFNIIVLAGIIRVFREMRGGAYDDEELEEQLNKRGLMNRFLGPLARRVDTPWKMYPIGFLFGLGFDTATEIALLVLAGTAVAGGLPFYAILSLPFLFAAGMSLFDTADGCFMNWTDNRPRLSRAGALSFRPPCAGSEHRTLRIDKQRGPGKLWSVERLAPLSRGPRDPPTSVASRRIRAIKSSYRMLFGSRWPFPPPSM